jgi:predicted DNA repair protein MutK
MAASSLLALIDDIATILDDVSVMAKVAVKKTSGVLGDDLALNAQQVTGVHANRELPVVWAVAKGSMLNKLILVPAALAISAFVPWLITPLLMLGGAYLCFEGFEKVAHRFWPHGGDEEHEKRMLALADPAVDMVALEKDKIKGAVRTDFILSAEIIAITLGVVANAPLVTQVSVLSSIAIGMTIGVYGLVAGIVKLDDAGLYLSQRPGSFQRNLGKAILAGAPWMMKSLSIIGTAAMFMVGGGILVHGVPALGEMLHHVEEAAHALPGVGGVLGWLASPLSGAIAGIVAGGIVFLLVGLAKRLFKRG